MASEDTGLGLTEFLSAKPTEPEATPTSPAQTDTATDDKKEVASPGPVGLEKDAKAAPEAAVGPDWEHESNPYRKKAEELDKRYRDTHKWGNEAHQKALEAERRAADVARQLEILGKKFDGTYDPQRDEPPPPDPTQIRQWAAIEGRVETSLAAVLETSKLEEVMPKLERFAELFGKDPAVQQRVLSDPHPIKAALKAVESHDFYSTYGSDPDSILKKLTEKWTNDELPKLRDAEMKRLQSEARKNEPPEPQGIGKVLGASGATESKVDRDNKGRFKPLSQVFGQ
jgi:hypothetical protein